MIGRRKEQGKDKAQDNGEEEERNNQLSNMKGIKNIEEANGKKDEEQNSNTDYN